MRALGPLGETADVPLLVQLLARPPGGKVGRPGEPRPVARADRQCGDRRRVQARRSPAIRVELLGVLAARRAMDTVPALLAAAEDADPAVRAAAMAALGQLAGPEHVADMLKGVLKAEPGPDARPRKRP